MLQRANVEYVTDVGETLARSLLKCKWQFTFIAMNIEMGL
jgi:hypothetical protein